MVQLKKLHFGYTGEILIFKDFDFSIAEGEFVCILGGSGSGKSTLLNLVSGILAPSQGKIERRPELEIGFVFQDYSLYPWLDVESNAALGLKIKGMGKEERLAQTRGVLKNVGLFEASHKYPHQLSGGMKQRVAIARAITNKSNLLLMDEPFGALDQTTRNEMQAFIRGIWRDSKTTARPLSIVFITHNIEEAYLLGERILIFKKGKPVAITEKQLPPNTNRDLFTDEYGVFRKEILELI